MRDSSLGSDKTDLIISEAEGCVLGVIARRQPITRYQLLRAFQMSPFNMPNKSKGSFYPLIRRLLERNFILAGASNRGRDTETLEISERGREALLHWVVSIDDSRVLPYDPLSIRALSLGEFTRQDRIRWVATAKELLWQKTEHLAEYRTMVRLPYGALVHDAAQASLDAQLRWLDQLLLEILNEDEPQTRAEYAWEAD